MKTFFKWLFIIFIVIISTIVYARYIGTMGLVTKEITIKEINIPTSFDGLKIVHFSDLHYNRAITLNKVSSIVKEINDTSQTTKLTSLTCSFFNSLMSVFSSETTLLLFFKLSSS